MARARGVNYRRGLFRLWMVLSVAYVLVVAISGVAAIRSILAADAEVQTGEQIGRYTIVPPPLAAGKQASDVFHIVILCLAAAAIPPIGAFGLGGGLFWAAEGFSEGVSHEMQAAVSSSD